MTSSIRRLPATAPRRQRGVVLMVALIVLVALTLAGLSMARTSDTGVVISGNLVFRQAATQALDAGVEAAIGTINTTWIGSGATTANKYYAFALPDADGDSLPDGINWTLANTLANPGGLTGYTARYVVERMCVPNPVSPGLPIVDTYAAAGPPGSNGLCNLEDEVKGADSGKLGGQSALGQIRKLHYRVTVKVEGPRNTETYAQTVIAATMN